ncbi:MAG: ABC transporter permease [Thermoplasmata archaeon]|jgi:ABC-2 type transport system permease protein|nr:ABC transporter permease subunit [Thermoplasmatales archaeon]HEU12957.1 hypothetical protein [Euryarchaeota archaeon]
MDRSQIITIYRKDLKEILTLATVKYSFIFFPLIFLFIMLFIILLTHNALLANNQLTDIAKLRFFSYMATNYLIFFGIIPLSLASTISSYSIVGEKTQRTIEPILATPIEDSEFFIGKMLAPFIPTMIATYIVAIFYTLFVDYLSLSFGGLVFPNLVWYVIILIFIPFSTILMILLTLIFSSRALDPRSAQQFSAIIIVPLLVVFIISMTQYAITSFMVVLMSVLIIIFDIIVYRIALRIFNREIIVSRWR